VSAAHPVRAGRGVPGGRRTLVFLLVVVLVEAVVVRAYLVRGVAWHGLLHTAVGIGLGLSAAALVSAARRRPVAALPFALAGQLVSVAPDLLFVLARLPHARWMDAFVGHVSIHTAPLPLPVALVVFLLGGWAWWWCAFGTRTAAGVGLAALALVLFAGALALREPLPTELADYRDPASAKFWCGTPPAAAPS